MTLNYTADNRLANITGKASYHYNGRGERAMKGVLAPGTAGFNGFKLQTVYVYGQNGQLLAELGSSGKVRQEYIYMNNELLATIIYQPNGGEPILNADMDGDGAVGVDDYLVWYFNHYNTGDLTRDVNEDGVLDTNDMNLVLNCALSGGAAAGCTTSSYDRSIYYAHNDHLGTPHMLTNETGVAVWSAVYDPFGKAAVNEDVDGNGNGVTLNIRFPGQYHDAESGLHYNYYRYYDPEAGRYVTSDPIGLKGGINTYLYVNNNPTRWIDKFGLYYTPFEHGYNREGKKVNNKPINFSLGAGGSVMFLFEYASADSGFSIDTTGTICLYSTICNGIGWNTPMGGELGMVGSVGTGKLCTGMQDKTGVYWGGGAGIVGQGQISSDGSYSRGLLGFGGSPEGPVSGVGGVSCSVATICINE
jgi:RHS repeat-associated protein